MNILYTCDNNYVWIMGISMISLFENNKNIGDITVFLLGEKISSNNKLLLKNIAEKYKRECIIIDMPEIEIPETLVSMRWPKSAFSRLYSAQLLPENVDKVLYLDCDTIILNNLIDIEQIDIKDYIVCGKKDCIGTLYRKNIGLKKDSVYVNAGVLLFNYKKLRKLNVSKMIDDFLEKYEKCIHYADQDVLNGIFTNNIGCLPAEYNVMTLEYMCSYNDIKSIRHPINYYSKEEFENALKNPKIIHFTTNMQNIRPWYVNSNHPMAKEFLKYKNMSPWKNMKLLEVNKKKTKKDNVFNILKFLPHKIEVDILGIIHSIFYPSWIKIKSKFKRKK